MISYIVTVSFQKSSSDVVRVIGQGLHRWHHRYIQQQNPHCRVVPWPCQGTWLFESQRITKLSSYGDHVITSGWFKSYLFNRKQSVNIRSPNSNHTPLQTGIASMGVPQASCHSSLHNNTPRTVTSESKPVLCADDTSIIIIYDPVKELFHNFINPLNAELNPICYLLALLGAHHFLHVSRIRVRSLTLRLLMSYIYGAPILDVSRSHTMTHHIR